jgi:hypothetical protein
MPTVAFRSLVAHPGAPPEAVFGLTAADEAGPVGAAVDADAEEEEAAAPLDPDEPDVAEGLEDKEEADCDPQPAMAVAAATMTRPAVPVSTVLRSDISPRSSLRLTMRLMKVRTLLRRRPISCGWPEIMSGSRRG